MGKIIYDWKTSKKLSDWKVEGLGEINISDGGALWIHTNNGFTGDGVKTRACNVWLKDLELPNNYEVEWTYKCYKRGKVMIIFNALPLELNSIFDDPRKAASYQDLSAGRKMIAYTLGFNRPGGPSVLRKLGGMVPESWETQNEIHEIWLDVNRTTSQSETSEPIIPDSDEKKEVKYRLRNQLGHIHFWINDILIHDYKDNGEYPYYKDALLGGKIAFRNFSGVSDDYYTSITIRELS